MILGVGHARIAEDFTLSMDTPPAATMNLRNLTHVWKIDFLGLTQRWYFCNLAKTFHT